MSGRAPVKIWFLLPLFGAMVGCGPAEQSKQVRVCYVSGQDELVHLAAKRFADAVQEKSQGRLKVRLYPGGQLGDERETVEGLQLRSSDICITGLAVIGWYAPEYGVLEAPFVWRDYEHVKHVWNGPIGREIREAMRKKSGITMLYPWYRGPRYLSTTSKIVRSPADLKGLKLRVPELEVYIKSWQAFGANTTPIQFNDMFMALKLGVVEGQENPLATIYSNNLHEVQKYIMDTEHLLGFYVVLTGEPFYEKFTEEERAVILAALEEATEWHNEQMQQKEVEYRKLLEEAGVEFVEVDRDAFRRIAQETIPPLFEDVWEKDLYQKISESP